MGERLKEPGTPDLPSPRHSRVFEICLDIEVQRNEVVCNECRGEMPPFIRHSASVKVLAEVVRLGLWQRSTLVEEISRLQMSKKTRDVVTIQVLDVRECETIDVPTSEQTGAATGPVLDEM